MDAEWKRKWVEALRSGEYQQARETIFEIDDDGNITSMCCLSVLTDLYVRENPACGVRFDARARVIIDDEGGFDKETDEVCQREEDEGLTRTVAVGVGLYDGNDPKIGDTSAIRHNDGCKTRANNAELDIPPKSFTEIADLIEKHL